MRRWIKFGFAGQFTSLTPVIEMKWSSQGGDPLTQLGPYPPVYVQMPHKSVLYENLNYSLGNGLGDSWSVYGTMWQFDFPNWIAPDPACNAQHLPVGSVIFPQNAATRLFDLLFQGFPPYPPLTDYTPPLFEISFDRPASITS
jgi:hypothetical protein